MEAGDPRFVPARQGRDRGGWLIPVQLALQFHHPAACFTAGGLFLAAFPHAGLFIVLPLAQFSQNTSLLAFLLKTP